MVFPLSEAPLQIRDPFLQLGDSPVLGQALLPPAVPYPFLELDRAPQDQPVLGIDPGTLLLYPPLQVPHVPPV
jgi:hypothetical protein